MIDQLLDQAFELNDKALNLMSGFATWEYRSYDGHHMSRFEWRLVSEEKMEELRNKAYLEQNKIEHDFKEILMTNLNVTFLNNIEDAVKLEPSFLLNYRTNRDLSDLIITTMSIECLRCSYFTERSLYHQKSPKNPLFGTWPGIEDAGENYKECKKFMSIYCPEALKLHETVVDLINKGVL